MVVCVACKTGVIFWHFSGEQRQAGGKRGVHVTLREGHKKNYACPHTIVHAVPAFICECSYPIIGYLMSCDHEMLLGNKMAVISSCSIDKAIENHFVFVFKINVLKEIQKKCIGFIGS